jgi:hypothetical protein
VYRENFTFTIVINSSKLLAAVGHELWFGTHRQAYGGRTDFCVGVGES